ncbi:MAG: tRNA (adenosine(37)-N6)-dimethylallyltransferase MiaA [Rickettsiales bacterium]|nr:tRNA (adenosine(37)-N6)-dimethylallyltransferase MiaA [Rickettsiales bacterium]
MGPTASGKTALGIRLAQALGGVIINADTMQCYADLSIITARPTDEEMAQAPHKLYGIWPVSTHGNAMMWQELAIAEIKNAHAAGKLPILLGGTGMYIKSLIEGMAEVPAIPPELHEATKARYEANPQAFYKELQTKDPVMAARLTEGDLQRQIRAMEVLEHTGKSLAAWQDMPANPVFPPESYTSCYIDWPREELYARIDQRFDMMIEEGVLTEIMQMMVAIKSAFPDADPRDFEAASVRGIHEEQRVRKYQTLPLLRAHGVPEMMAYLCGDTTLEAAIDKAKQNTRNYAKRQLTFLRNQMPEAIVIPPDWSQDAQKAQQTIERLAKTIDRPLATH